MSFSNRLTLNTEIKVHEYGPKNTKWQFNNTEILHLEGHYFTFVNDAESITVTLGHIWRLVEAASTYETPGKALDALRK